MTHCWGRQIKKGSGWFRHPKRFSQPGAATLLKEAAVGGWEVEGCTGGVGCTPWASAFSLRAWTMRKHMATSTTFHRQLRAGPDVGLGGGRSTEQKPSMDGGRGGVQCSGVGGAFVGAVQIKGLDEDSVSVCLLVCLCGRGMGVTAVNLNVSDRKTAADHYHKSDKR